jgi:hypothetical protein
MTIDWLGNQTLNRFPYNIHDFGIERAHTDHLHRFVGCVTLGIIAEATRRPVDQNPNPRGLLVPSSWYAKAHS